MKRPYTSDSWTRFKELMQQLVSRISKIEEGAIGKLASHIVLSGDSVSGKGSDGGYTGPIATGGIQVGGRLNLFSDSEGGNVRIISPSGKNAYEQDAYDGNYRLHGNINGSEIQLFTLSANGTPRFPSGVLPVSDGGTGAGTVDSAPFVAKTGGTMSGDLTISRTDASISLTVPQYGSSFRIHAFSGAAGQGRWAVYIPKINVNTVVIREDSGLVEFPNGIINRGLTEPNIVRGSSEVAVSASRTLSYGHTFASAPTVYLQYRGSSPHIYSVSTQNIGTSSCTVYGRSTSGSGGSSTETIYFDWVAIGV